MPANWIQNNRHRIRRVAGRWWNNQNIARMAARVRRHAEIEEDAQPVIFFNASTRLEAMSLNAAFSLLSSWAVQLAGVPVVHFVCENGMSRCVLGTNRDDPLAEPPCWRCILQSRATYAYANRRKFTFVYDAQLSKILQPMQLAELMEFEHNGLPLGSLVLPALRWVLRRNTLADDQATCYLYRHYILSANHVAQEFSALLDETNPRAVVVFNGQFYPEATARLIAMRRGLPVFSHEVGLRPFTAYFTRGEATAYPLAVPDDFELDEKQSQRLDAYLAQRFQGNFSMAGIRFWSDMRSLSPEFLERASHFKQIVPVFTNVIFDTSQSHANVIYPDMFAWLDEVHQVMAANPETLFVLRAHPDESRPGKQSRESVADWVRKCGVADLPNVLFVDSTEPFSSYELIQRSKFVMIYNSTIGLEASIMGAAVLSAGKARFTQLSTVFLPATHEEYRRQLDTFLAAETIPVPPEFSRNARRFLYYQLYRSSLPFGDYLEDDRIWRGFVRMKRFGWKDLHPSSSPTMKVIVDGILNCEDFLLRDESILD